jgi:hypothetical protein
MIQVVVTQPRAVESFAVQRLIAETGITEEVDSLYRTIVDAIVHYDPGLPE